MVTHVTPNAEKNGTQAVIMDWAGTTIDFGCMAPVETLVNVFAQHGVGLTAQEARRDMGLPKRAHIEAVGHLPRVAMAWQDQHGHAMSAHDLDVLYSAFTQAHLSTVTEHAALVPGALSTLAYLRERRIKIGSTTGYNRAVMAVLSPLAAAQGYMPDALVCADDVPSSRPGPLAVYLTCVLLNAWPAASVIKVDDTAPGLMEGRHAGAWTVAVLASGNTVGMTHAQWVGLDASARQAQRTLAQQALSDAAPDVMIDTLADLPDAVACIERWRSQGQLPGGR
jgi:phosphonoacetaldehyde hydrolase